MVVLHSGSSLLTLAVASAVLGLWCNILPSGSKLLRFNSKDHPSPSTLPAVATLHFAGLGPFFLSLTPESARVRRVWECGSMDENLKEHEVYAQDIKWVFKLWFLVFIPMFLQECSPEKPSSGTPFYVCKLWCLTQCSWTSALLGSSPSTATESLVGSVQSLKQCARASQEAT